MGIFSFLFWVSGVAYADEGSKQKQQGKYNVLFIITDDLTATTISSYENKACHTPNIDRLASEGVRFTRAYCQYPVCGPSRASLMSGYYPDATRVFKCASGREQIGKKRKMWPEYFKEKGYYTARISKIFHMNVPRDIIAGRDGTDDPACWVEKFNSKDPESWTPGKGERLEHNPKELLPTQKGGEYKNRNTLEYVKTDGDELELTDGQTAAKASELIRKYKDKRFFLAVGFVRPHVPFVAPKAYYEPYPWEKIQLPRKVKGDWDDIPKAGINYKTSKNLQLNTRQEKKAVAAYYASVSFMDAQVGKVLKTLKEEGLEDNTIVIFTSDHGFFLCEHNFWMKVGLMDESVRVPLIIKVPGQQPAVCKNFVELIDLYPTTVELCGFEVPKRLQGKSLIKTIAEPDRKVRDFAFSRTAGNGFLIRTKKWALIQHHENGSKGIQLYDMQHDPSQFTNLANNPEYAEVLKMMQNQLKQKLAEVRTNDLGIEYQKKKKSAGTPKYKR
jgi:choline-sulfatase